MTAASIWVHVTAADMATAAMPLAPLTPLTPVGSASVDVAHPWTPPSTPASTPTPGRAWEQLSLPALSDRLQRDGHVALVVLAVPDHAAALTALDPAASGALALALERLTVVVLVATADPDAATEEALYARGVQDVWGPSDAAAVGAAQRLSAAVARKAAVLASRPAHATDPDTGLVNRAQLIEHLSHLLAVRAREPAPIGLVVLQLGQGQVLKGALKMDQLVLARRKLAVRLRASVRASDVVAAIGPELYAVMLSWVDTPADTRAVATKLGVAMRHPVSLAGEAVSVPVQVGWAVSPEDGDQPEDLLRRALQRITTTAFNPRQAANDP